jgi:hypothetical protein
LLSKFTILDKDSGINEFFEENGFESSILVMNLGSTLLYLVISIGVLMIYGGIHLLGKYMSW